MYIDTEGQKDGQPNGVLTRTSLVHVINNNTECTPHVRSIHVRLAFLVRLHDALHLSNAVLLHNKSTSEN